MPAYWKRTRKGVVVYKRPKHTFGWRAVFRIVSKIIRDPIESWELGPVIRIFNMLGNRLLLEDPKEILGKSWEEFLDDLKTGTRFLPLREEKHVPR